MNTLQVKNLYLKFMEQRGWPIRDSEKLIHSTFPHCFVISGAVDWFNKKLRNDPFTGEAYTICQRVFRHFDPPDKTHLPFFWMLIDIPWNIHSREKVIQDNFNFFKELGLDPHKLKVSYWAGGKIYGKGIKLKADVEELCQGSEFENMVRKGFYLPPDIEALNAWENCGLNEEQFVACGEIGAVDPSGLDSILLNAREHFAGVRSELYYNGVELGPFLHEAYLKKTVALRDKIPQDVFEDDLSGDKFLLCLKPKVVPGGFGLERLTMAVNGLTSVYGLEPYVAMKDFLMNSGATNEKLVEQIVAYVPGTLWLIHDGAHLFSMSRETQRVGIYRKAVKTVIQGLRQLGLDRDEIYTRLFQKVVDFYSLWDENLDGIVATACQEIDKQKRRIEIHKSGH